MYDFVQTGDKPESSLIRLAEANSKFLFKTEKPAIYAIAGFFAL